MGVVIPLGPEYPLSAAFRWQLKAYYSVKFWNLQVGVCGNDPTVQFASIQGDPTIGVGWTLQLGYVTASKISGTSILNPPVYFSSDGGQHGADIYGVTSDGSHLKILPIGDPNAPSSYKVLFPDGRTEYFEQRWTPPQGAWGDFSGAYLPQPTAYMPDRYYLTRIQDRFNSFVLQVNYSSAGSSQFSSIVLSPTGGSAQTITFQWVQPTGGISWPVVGSMTFPEPGLQQRKVTFSYDASDFTRNAYDSANTQIDNPNADVDPRTGRHLNCHTLPEHVVGAPILRSVTYQDNASPASFAAFQYGFSYFGDASALSLQNQSALQTITLPTGGTIQYDYDSTTGTPCSLQGCDPEGSSSPPGGNAVLSVGSLADNLHPFQAFVDKSMAIVKRTEKESAAASPAVTTYKRQFIFSVPDPDHPNADTATLYRRVNITEPNNDPGAPGWPQIFTRSYYRVNSAGASFPGMTGMEVDRRSYTNGSDASQNLIRTTIRCYGHSSPACGYRNSSGGLQTIDMTGITDVEPPQAEVTWYGSVPNGSDGSPASCNLSSSPCTSSSSSNYIFTPGTPSYPIGQYGTSVITSTLPGSAGWSRNTTTNWNPQTNPKWMLDIISSKTVTDNPTPAPAIVATTFTFNLNNGFLNSAWTSDGANGILTRSYANPSGNGDPTTETVAGTSGLLGTFTDTRTFQGGLALTQQRTGMSWKSFDVTRDPATGSITASRDPNSSLQSAYTYDALGRLKTVTPAGGEAPTTISYDTVTQTTLTRSGSDGSATWQRYRYDGLGRLIRELRQMPSGYAARAHAYDIAGHHVSLSEWATCTTPTGDCLTAGSVGSCQVANPPGTTTCNFDPFGRAQTITRADGTVTTIDYTDNGVSPSILFSESLQKVTVSVGVVPSTTATRKDALGRIIKVTEPDLPGQSVPVVCSPFRLDTFSEPKMGSRKAVSDGRDTSEGRRTADLFG